MKKIIFLPLFSCLLSAAPAQDLPEPDRVAEISDQLEELINKARPKQKRQEADEEPKEKQPAEESDAPAKKSTPKKKADEKQDKDKDESGDEDKKGSSEPEHSESNQDEDEEEAENAPRTAANLVAAGKAATAEQQAARALSSKVTQLKTEKEILDLLNSVATARIKQEHVDRQVAVEEMRMETAELEAKQKLEEARRRAEQSDEIVKLKAESELLILKNNIAKAESDKVISQNKAREMGLLSEINSLKLEIQRKEQEADNRQYTEEYQPVYLEDPLDGRTLIVSDRRIEMNDTVTSRTADHVTERIHYFNNQDKQMPIFIVIDDSPGGSVMAGYRILKAMEGSEAPVYVVVKSFAASMAACITTLAERSFAYPNAVILHHQIAGIGFGNLTEQREMVEMLEEWWQRLAQPVADKMGLSRDEFIERMYSNSSTGDWEEFADDAHKLKWVDHIVDEIRETAIVRNPDFKKAVPRSSGMPIFIPRTSEEGGTVAEFESLPINGLQPMLDEDGKAFVQLPRINPFDAYWIHNPDGFFRAPK